MVKVNLVSKRFTNAGYGIGNFIYSSLLRQGGEILLALDFERDFNKLKHLVEVPDTKNYPGCRWIKKVK